MVENTTTAMLAPVDSIIRVKQLPIIEEQLRALKADIERQTGDAMLLACTADTVAEVKRVRAELNRRFSALEDARKDVKKAIMEPYNKFEETYRECVTEPFNRADNDLKGKIDAVEDALKTACEESLQQYFNELRDVRGLPWLEYERAGVKVDMASAKAKTPKRLMDALKLFVDGVAQSVATIGGMDDAAEIMTEYKATLDLSGAIGAVQERKRRVEAERQAAEERARREAERAAARAEQERQTEAYAPPVTVSEPPKAVQAAAVKRYALELRVEGTLEQMRLIKQYLTSNGYQYSVSRFSEIKEAQ